ncbi:CBS domain pair family protein [Abditibacterium utsteinense]|uniref:CBS domain pair family protein n=1 Tax=Abditibacterium utsteinense TaxID=1960156 RepID=A0A2S8STV4_9BACT|nr:hemolysin family protein [Abditibacterium utsteinense]PQV64235.1 CBS domain pair family protein [Abditibacterium utsteinense]
MDSFPPRFFVGRAALWLAPCFFALPFAAFAAPEATHVAPGGAANDSTLLNLLVVMLLVLANGFFVASEFALVAVRKTRIDQLAAEGSGAAVVVQRALKDLDRYIAATQVGITVASLILGGVGEKTFHHLFEPLFGFLPDDQSFFSRGTVAIGLAYFVMTALHVIIGELMPKSIALQDAEKTSLLIGRPMTLIAKIFAPLIWMLNGTGGFLLRRIGIHSAEGHGGTVHSPEELDLLVKESHQGGELNDTEAEILHRVVRFSDLTLREVMVPRTEMQGLPVEMPRLALRAWIHSQPHSRVPVFLGSMDEVIGIVHLKDMVPFAAKFSQGDDDTQISLMPLVREALRLPETSTVDKLLAEFKRRRQQMAIVIDEFGGTSGLITLGDLLEQVFGEVADEFDTPEAEIAALGDGRLLLSGRTLIDEVNDRHSTGFRSDEADTMAGLILSSLGRVAKVGDEVEINGAKLRVEAIDRLKITRMSLLLPAQREAEEVGAEAPAAS